MNGNWKNEKSALIFFYCLLGNLRVLGEDVDVGGVCVDGVDEDGAAPVVEQLQSVQPHVVSVAPRRVDVQSESAPITHNTQRA